MKILLVYPEYPVTYWSFHYALKFVSKKASFPPLGLLTVANMLPGEWEKALIDMNVSILKDEDIKWADYVFVSAMVIQKESVKRVIAQCKRLGTKMVAGGPLFTTSYEEYASIEHLVLNEAEVTLPQFLDDLKCGQARHIYTSDEWADMRKTPVPLWDLVNFKRYASMNLQYSRGCPFNCGFCNITLLYGQTPRTKDKNQIINELNELYMRGWRGGVFFVDDNLIGNKKKLKSEILPAIIEWMDKNRQPFILSTEVSINLADDEELIKLMVRAGFSTVFIGIETINEESLKECNKYQNRNRDLITSVKNIQRLGLQVQGGFIVGFDNDPPTIFERLVGFIQESGIVTAMVGLLNAPRGTMLYQRMKEEGRLLNDISGDNTDFTINFIPKMNYEKLMKGYKSIIGTIYSPRNYYERVIKFLKEFRPAESKITEFNLTNIKAVFKSILFLGILGKERVYYWKLIFWSMFRCPRLLPMAISFSIYGFHFRKVYEDY